MMAPIETAKWVFFDAGAYRVDVGAYRHKCDVRGRDLEAYILFANSMCVRQSVCEVGNRNLPLTN
jgi:hypothetical protein